MQTLTSAQAIGVPHQPAVIAAEALDYLAPLNSQQRVAVEHGVGESRAEQQGPLLVIAGAGSGKTNTLAYRVAHLVFTGVDPQRILLLTFSRRAAAEMERRAGQILTRVLGASGLREPPALPWAGTFHSIGARILREYAARIGLQESFTIHDRPDSEDLLALVRHDLGLSATETRFPTKASCIGIYSRVVNSQVALGQVLKRTFPWCAMWEPELAKLFEGYVATKQAQNVVDYDDLLLYWSQIVAEPILAREIGDRFDHVLVDEYQDTNRLQASILLSLKPQGEGMMVVGDDAQSIYSFRAAAIRNILDFPNQFTPPARVVTLDRNYRSTQPILEASNAVIGLAAERFTKNLWTDLTSSQKPQLVTVCDQGDQARYVVNRVLEQYESGIALKSQAALFRSGRDSAQLELELARRRIPFVKYGGLKFLEAAHVKDVLAVLRWAENPRNRVAGFRALRLLPGVGAATATKIMNAFDAAPDPMGALVAMKMPPSATSDWSAFLAVYDALTGPTPKWPVDFELVSRWYEPHLRRKYDDAAVRQEDLAQLQQIASTFASRERFLTEVTLDPPEATNARSSGQEEDDDYFVLSTIHSAKGQEWQSVYVLNVVEGCIPSGMGTGTSEEIEEERRLLYVAMTRAKFNLHLIAPQRLYVTKQSTNGDRHVYVSRTRFIPDVLTDLFETCAWPDSALTTDRCDTQTSESKFVIDIAQRVRAQWGTGPH